jgi:hypothetical protein
MVPRRREKIRVAGDAQARRHRRHVGGVYAPLGLRLTPTDPRQPVRCRHQAQVTIDMNDLDAKVALGHLMPEKAQRICNPRRG